MAEMGESEVVQVPDSSENMRWLSFFTPREESDEARAQNSSANTGWLSFLTLLQSAEFIHPCILLVTVFGNLVLLSIERRPFLSIRRSFHLLSGRSFHPWSPRPSRSLIVALLDMHQPEQSHERCRKHISSHLQGREPA